MSSRKRQGQDLLVRLRYQNPLPLPPFGPKALNLSTDLGRFGRDFQTLRSLESDRPVAFVADAELGMPLDLGNLNHPQDFFAGQRSHVDFDPSQEALGLDAEDAELCEPLDEVLGVRKPNLAARAQPRASTTGVSWLRRPEMFDSASNKNRYEDRSGTSTPVKRQLVADLSPEEKRQLVLSSFDDANAPLEQLRHLHPHKKHLTAVSSMPVLPNVHIWGNHYHLYKFQNEPSEEVQQLDRALLRNVVFPDGEQRVGYFVASDEQGVERFTASKRSRPLADDQDPNATMLEPEDEAHIFRHTRDYEPAGKRDLNSEFLLSVEAGPSNTEEDVKPSEKAYYAPLTSMQKLKRRRPKKGAESNEYDDAVQKWDVIRSRLGLALSVMGDFHEQRQVDLAAFQPPHHDTQDQPLQQDVEGQR